MASVMMAIKPKYPTRKAVDAILENRKDYVNICTVDAATQAIALMGTSYVAIYKDNAMYPVDVDNVADQIALVAAGEAPTVDADANFGVVGLESFLKVVDSQCQKNMSCVAGILHGDIIKITEVNDTYDKVGFYLEVSIDASAATAGYTNIKLNGEDVQAKYYLGSDEEDVIKARLVLSATYTPVNGGDAEEVSVVVENRMSPLALVLSTEKAPGQPAISVDGKEYSTLADAIAAISTSGTITVAKDTKVTNDITIMNKEITIKLENNATIWFVDGMSLVLRAGAEVGVVGKGSLKEVTPTYSPLYLINADETKSINLYVGSDITVEGWTGLFYAKGTYNSNAVVDGTLNGVGEGGCAIYCHGNANSASLVFNGKGYGLGTGMYLPGHIDTIITGSVESGDAADSSAIECKNGSITIKKGAVLKTPCKDVAMVKNLNGTCSKGCALAACQVLKDTTLTVNIEGGTLVGGCAFMEGNPNAIEGAIDRDYLSITGGTFTCYGDDVVKALDDSCNKHYITGGEFGKKPADDFIAIGYSATLNNGRYVVSK